MYIPGDFSALLGQLVTSINRINPNFPIPITLTNYDKIRTEKHLTLNFTVSRKLAMSKRKFLKFYSKFRFQWIMNCKVIHQVCLSNFHVLFGIKTLLDLFRRAMDYIDRYNRYILTHIYIITIYYLNKGKKWRKTGKKDSLLWNTFLKLKKQN